MPKHQTTTEDFEQIGMAAMMPGIAFAVKILEQQIQEIKDAIAGNANGAGKRGPGRPPKPFFAEKTPNDEARGGWPADPEARSAEMMRRQMVAREKRLAEESHAKRVAAGKARWAGRSKKEIAEHSRKMNEAKKKTVPRGSANPNHPGNPNHPDHAAFAAKMVAARRARARQERAAA